MAGTAFLHYILCRSTPQSTNHPLKTPNGLSKPRGHLPSKPCKPLFFLQMPENRSGAESRTRTDDLLITNQLLYQLSYFGPPLRLYRCARLR